MKELQNFEFSPHIKKRSTPVASSMLELHRKLRNRKMMFLRTDFPLISILPENTPIDNDTVDNLSVYFARRATAFWKENLSEKDKYECCYRFYRVVFKGLLSGKVATCINDLLVLSETLARSKQIFSLTMQQMLPESELSELFEFLDSYDESYFSARFEDAILGSVCAFVGALNDPCEPERKDTEDHEC